MRLSEPLLQPTPLNESILLKEHKVLFPSPSAPGLIRDLLFKAGLSLVTRPGMVEMSLRFRVIEILQEEFRMKNSIG